ncbi:MAG: hypothetical protein BWZ07_03343 [Alphaproteobacteria bacterium ADurb.BinA280]|nr:MAG: hypothetical protein BWZ07_03343 [Alphaproteobacteria bacterium ADurb.BinA280]
MRVTGVDDEASVRMVLEDLAFEIACLVGLARIAGRITGFIGIDPITQLDCRIDHVRVDRLLCVEARGRRGVTALDQIFDVVRIQRFGCKRIETLGAQAGQHLYGEAAGLRIAVVLVEEHRLSPLGEACNRVDGRLGVVSALIQW